MVYDFDDSDIRAGQERITGPYPARWRDKWSFVLADVDDIPELDRTSGGTYTLHTLHTRFCVATLISLIS